MDPVNPQIPSGGFRKLSDKGAWFPDCRHLASGFTSTGIANLVTGAWPAQHGIVADSWYDRVSKSRVRANEEALLAGTLLSEVVEYGGNVVTVALDGAQARLAAGPAKSDIYWMDERGQMQTNNDPPAWLTPFNERRSLERFHDYRWTVQGVKTDAPPVRTLSYDPQHPDQFMELFRASPVAQDAIFEFAAEVLNNEGLGQQTNSTTDVLCLIENSTERLGYEVGARFEVMDQLVRELDHRIDILLSQLVKLYGETGFSLVMVGAHGAPDNPPPQARERMVVDGEALARKIDTALAARGLGRVEKYLYPFMYLDSSGFRDAEEIRKAAGRALLEQPAVADFFTAEGSSSTQNEWRERFRNSFHAKRSGDVMVSYQAGFVENFGQGRGISYGSLYNYDARVPLCLYGPQFRTGVFDRMVEAVDLAPTLARVMGAETPGSSMGRVLQEALA